MALHLQRSLICYSKQKEIGKGGQDEVEQLER